MKRAYVDGRRNRRIKVTEEGVVSLPRDFPLNEWHHVMVVDLPWWRVAAGWVKWAVCGWWWRP